MRAGRAGSARTAQIRSRRGPEGFPVQLRAARAASACSSAGAIIERRRLLSRAKYQLPLPDSSDGAD